MDAHNAGKFGTAACQLEDALPVPCDALPVHVAGEHEESELGALSRGPFRMVIEVRATVDDKDARPATRARGVPHQDAL